MNLDQKYVCSNCQSRLYERVERKKTSDYSTPVYETAIRCRECGHEKIISTLSPWQGGSVSWSLDESEIKEY